MSTDRSTMGVRDHSPPAGKASSSFHHEHDRGGRRLAGNAGGVMGVNTHLQLKCYRTCFQVKVKCVPPL